MFFRFTDSTTPLFIFFVQGLIFSGLLWIKGRRLKQDHQRWLSVYLLLSCLYIVPWMCGYSGWYSKDGFREFLFFVPFQQLYFIGPVLFFYVQSLLIPNFEFRRRHLLHFVPGILYLLYSLIVFVVDVFLLEEFYFYADYRDKDMAEWYQLTGLASMILYGGLSIRFYNSYRKKIVETLSFADQFRFSWVQRFLIAFLLILAVRTLFFVLYPSFGDFGNKFWYYLIFSAISYYIALQGYTHSVSSQLAERSEKITLSLGEISDPFLMPEYQPSPEGKGPKVAKLSTEELDIKAHIIQIMEEQQLFKNPTLTLSDIAQEVGITSKEVSRIINQGFGKNFNDFINEYRVQEVISRFKRQEHEQMTILAIALDAGFNSKTTFNRVFKRVMGTAPAKYLQQKENDTSLASPKKG